MKLLPKFKSFLFFAPAGWGKTSLVFELYRRNHWNFLIISPLKSLELELNKKIQKQEQKQKVKAPSIFIKALTAELVPNFLQSLTQKELNNLLIVFDEIHLWNHWGEKFRYRLWECFYIIANKGLPFLGLTATMHNEYLIQWRKLLEEGGYENRILDIGNGKIEFNPKNEISYWGLSKQRFMRRLTFELDKRERCLVFCQYKTEVYRLEQFLKKIGIETKTCIGGGSLEFMQACEAEGVPKVVISTSVLSHGVNLGSIKKVFILYEIPRWDIYLQMVARGGRAGHGFEVFCFQRGKTSFLKKMKLILYFYVQVKLVE